MIIGKCSRREFLAAITDDPADKFAKTFVAKADMLDAWTNCLCVREGSAIMGAVIMTFSKRTPTVANLQLLHTFAAYRKMGVGKLLMEDAIAEASQRADYFRVSAEKDAVAFYERIGLKFWGEQKSGCRLCMFRFGPEQQPQYLLHDRIIHAAVFRRGKGGVVKLAEPSIAED